MLGKSNLAAEKPVRRNKPTTSYFVFTSIFAAIIFCQTFYWLFANHINPMVFGFPISMFFVTVLVIFEFVVLVFLYKFDQS
jgi:hypothetical protein